MVIKNSFISRGGYLLEVFEKTEIPTVSLVYEKCRIDAY